MVRFKPIFILAVTLVFFQADLTAQTKTINTLLEGKSQVSTDTLENKINSMAQKLPQLPDSLLPSFHQVNSIRNRFNLQADSLKNEYEQSISRIDVRTNKISSTIDSLQDLNLP